MLHSAGGQAFDQHVHDLVIATVCSWTAAEQGPVWSQVR